MALLQRTIQRKLSDLLGADVKFEQINVSLLKGVIDARGVSVANVLRARRIKAEVSLAKALRKSIEIKSITIENPIISMEQRADGSLNLPKRTTPTTQPDDNDADGEVSEWNLDLQKVLLVDGEVHFHGSWKSLAGYEIVARNILADLTRADDGFKLTLIIPSTSRIDRPATAGELKLMANITGVLDLRQILNGAVNATIDLGTTFQLTLDSPTIRSGIIRFNMAGTIDTPELLTWLPIASSVGSNSTRI